MQVEEGKVIEGKITGITNFGAFVSLPDGKTGLVHISEVAIDYVKDIREHLKENDIVKVKVMGVDKNGKISLSIKKAIENIKNIKPIDIDWNKKNSNTNLSFEDKLLKFKQDSEEKMHHIKRNMESKRGGGGYKKSANNF